MKAMSSMGARMTHGASSIWSRLRPGCPRKTACMKRARKKESSLLLASQNVEDFLLPEAAELTKPLFSIPAYQFLFHPGTVDGGKYREALQLEECEYGVVRSCARGNCLFKCGDERYNLLVKTPPHKLRCYGTAGGR